MDSVTLLRERIAEAYGAAVHRPDDPFVIECYSHFLRELKEQYATLPVMVVWMESDPYGSSTEMFEDVERGYLKVLRTDPASLPEDHPMLRVSGIDPNLDANDIFRAVHDFYGHYQGFAGFGKTGEYRAWLKHTTMFRSPLARLALFTETRGQNDWVNFGPHRGLPPKERPFADQKATILASLCVESHNLEGIPL